MRAWHTQRYANMPDGWRWLTGDASWEDYGGSWYKRIGTSDRYLVIRVDRLPDGDEWCVDLVMVDLSDIDTASVLRSSGFKQADDRSIVNDYDGEQVCDAETAPICIVDCAVGYGASCPLDSVIGSKHVLRLLSRMRRAGEAYIADAEALEDKLDAIGTPSRDYGAGRI